MFGNRKRKLQDEEESLVPHGLVWHATAEPTPEDAAKSEEALGYTVNYAQEIERARREQSTQPAERTPDAGSAAPSIKAAVIPWWRMEQPEPTVERPPSKPAPMPLSAYVPTPVEPAVEPPRQPRSLPIQIIPQPSPDKVQPVVVPPPVVQPISAASTVAPEAIQPPVLQASAPRVEGSLAPAVQFQELPRTRPVPDVSTVAEPQAAERLVPKVSEITESFALVFSRLRAAGKTVWLALGSVSGKAAERGRQTVRSMELGEGIAQAGRQSKTLMHGGLAKTGKYARLAGTAVGGYSRAGVLRVQQLSARVRTLSRSATTDVVRPANTEPSRPSQIGAYVSTSALRARIIAAQQLSAWRVRRERVAVDSRFWTSMTMSAIAAVLALIIVSVVPHYAAKSLPSRILTNPSVNANVATPASASTAAPTATPAEKPISHSAKTITPATQQALNDKTAVRQASSVKPAAKPKARHVAYDDYVAPNTYKYYGNRSKASR